MQIDTTNVLRRQPVSVFHLDS